MQKASQKNGWNPDFLLISTLVTPWMWEMILLLPNPLYYFVVWIFQFSPPKNLLSPIQQDLLENRTTSVGWSLGEFVAIGDRFKYPTPICSAIYSKIKKIENEKNSINNEIDNFKDIEAIVDRLRQSKSIQSFDEFRYWLIRLVALLTLIPIILFLSYF